MEVQQPTISDHNLHLKETQTWRDNAKNSSARLDEWVIRSNAKKHLYKWYEIGDKVYIRCKKEKGKKKSMKHMIKVGSMIKKYRDDTNYDIRTEGPGHRLMKKLRIKDLADCPCGKHSKSHPLLIPLNRLRSITEQRYEVL